MRLIENANPKRNPMTTFPGIVFLLISAIMYVIKYIVPAFVVLKAEIPYEWYTPLLPLVVGLLLMFINDTYFERIFNRADRIVGKKTDT